MIKISITSNVRNIPVKMLTVLLIYSRNLQEIYNKILLIKLNVERIYAVDHCSQSN